MKYIFISVLLFLLNISPAQAISVDLQFISLELPNGFSNEVWQGEDSSGGRIISVDRNIIVDYFADKGPHIDKEEKNKYRIFGKGKKDQFIYYYAVQKNNLLVSLGTEEKDLILYSYELSEKNDYKDVLEFILSIKIKEKISWAAPEKDK